MKTNRNHKIIAVFLTLNFLTTLVPVNQLFANTNGPKAPEAASFEPVDATDMVNLVTGDFSYVLPLLDVPSPEGSYPLALAYHAGIAMDQEASWVGLGWNLNPGAINRNINGYPDDYNSSLLTEYFYDEGGQSNVYSLSIGYTNGGVSTGLGFSWGSDRAFGGSVNIGYGIGTDETGRLGGSLSIGSNGASIGITATHKGGLQLGLNASTSGNVGGSVGFDNNGEGFNLGYGSKSGLNGGVSFGENGKGVLDVSISSSGVGFNYGKRSTKPGESSKTVAAGGGVGLSYAFNNSVEMGDYVTQTNGWTIPLFVPLGPGFLSLSFGKQTFKYHLSDKKANYITGPLNFNNDILNGVRYRMRCTEFVYLNITRDCKTEYFFSEQLALDAAAAENNDGDSCAQCVVSVFDTDEAFMDMYEFSLANNEIEDETDVTKQNLSFPSYDNYNVQAQGISGNMSAKLWENGALFGLSNEETDQDYMLNYTFNGTDDNLPGHVKFSATPYFQFDNEINTYLEVQPADLSIFSGSGDVFNTVTSPEDLYSGGVNNNPLDKRVTSNYIVHYTNGQIEEASRSFDLDMLGYLKPSVTEFDRELFPEDGIGAFQITAADGKTYHYSLPVYNHETVVRTFGLVSDNPKEKDSYLEKRQLEPYATHWLLTAVTGPDYMDDGDNIPDEGDLGYWVNFDYGKWSDAFVWKSPYGKEYLENSENEDIKTWIKGRKELYYLDAVKTRTHTAIFVKSERTDAASEEWKYESVAHDQTSQNSSDYTERFTIPAQNQLRLDKIVLLKNEDAQSFTKGNTHTKQGATTIFYNDSEKPPELAGFNLGDKVFDTDDTITTANAIKVIDFGYDYHLKSSQGALSLNRVDFKGKNGVSVMPPYQFDYKDRIYSGDIFYTFNINDQDSWGYHKDDNSLWSLNQITTPQGGKIQVRYEGHDFIPVIESRIKFAKDDDIDFNISYVGTTDNTFRIKSRKNIGVKVGETLKLGYTYSCNNSSPSTIKIYVNAVVIEDEGNNSFILEPGTEVINQDQDLCQVYPSYPISYEAEYKIKNPVLSFGGIRTKSITTTDGIDAYKTEYTYGANEDGVGYISYLPFAPELQEELPYAQELPAPKVMYEYVTMASFDTQGQQVNGKTVYKFNVIKEKDENKIKFGDFFEIEESTADGFVYSNDTPIYNYIGEYTIKDNLAAIGQLLEVSVYNNEDNLLSKMVNHYYEPGTTENKLGVTQESYQNYKKVSFNDKDDLWNIATASTRVTYPNLLKGTTEYRDGFEFNTTYASFDENVGQATVVETINSENQKLRSTTVPAYTKYPEMGSKVVDFNNMNMLIQETLSYTELEHGGQWKKLAADITTWKPFHQVLNSIIEYSSISLPYTNEKDIWRKHKNFTWDGTTDTNGFFSNYVGEDDGFDWSDPNATQPAQWQQQSEISMYNEYSVPLEVIDINQNRASTKMGYRDTKVLSVSNAAYNEQFYSGAEDLDGEVFGGDVLKGQAEQISSDVHTGDYALRVSSGQTAFEVNVEAIRSNAFKASLWTKFAGHQNVRLRVNGALKSPNSGEIIRAGDWVMLNFYFNINATQTVNVTSTGGIAIVDDFRICPVNASVTSYVYNQWDELTYIIGGNNMANKFEYDALGRLISTYVEVEDFNGTGSGGFKKITETAYTYKNQ